MREQGFSAGIINVVEKNVYGVVVGEYKLFFVPEGYQPAKISFKINGQKITINSSIELEGEGYAVIEDIKNYVDPETLIKISTNSNTVTYYTPSTIKGVVLNEGKTYSITIFDRFGNNYTVKITL